MIFCVIIFLVECENYVGWVIDVKVCKKCKGHVANKTRICKFCGADVSNAKIIKNVNNVNNRDVNKNAKKSKTANNSALIKKSEHHVKIEKQSVDFDKVNEIENVNVTGVFSSNNQTDNNKNALLIKDRLLKFFEFIKLWSHKCVLMLVRFLKWLFYSFDRILDFISKILAIFIVKICKYGNIFVTFIFNKSFWLLKNIFIVIKKVIGVIGKSLYVLGSKIKAIGVLIKNSFQKSIAAISSSSKDRKRVKELKKVEVNNKELVVNEETKKDKSRNNSNDKHLHVLKPVLIVFFILVFLSIGSYIGINVYNNYKSTTDAVIVSEKATREKIFSMNDVISYNGVDYKIVKVDTSNGNSYKSPKDGNQFLIVTVYIKNNTDDKVLYSYENWTMSNSKGEEKKRIFSSINVDNALYSGELVIGGIKTGSMVFEQPINDSKLILNYYDLKKDDNGNDVIDEAKREFSVSIKVPSEGGKKTSNKGSDTKVIQTSEKVKN